MRYIQDVGIAPNMVFRAISGLSNPPSRYLLLLLMDKALQNPHRIILSLLQHRTRWLLRELPSTSSDRTRTL